MEIEQLLHLPHYLDLPSFDAVRNIPLDFASQRPEHYSKQILVLCPFGDLYRENNWHLHLRRHLPIFMSRASESIDVIRTLDMKSPRLVSQVLYEALRFTPLCIVDWTGWRSNVFFELGVRLAVSDIGPICIIDQDHKELTEAIIEGERKFQHAKIPKGFSDNDINRLKNCHNQCAHLLKLFNPISYRTGGDADIKAYERMIKYHKDVLAYLDPLNTVQWEATRGSLTPDYSYRVITDKINWKVEITGKPVYHELIDSANKLSIPGVDTKGRWPILYPGNDKLRQSAQESADERLLAAWYYLEQSF